MITVKIFDTQMDVFLEKKGVTEINITHRDERCGRGEGADYWIKYEGGTLSVDGDAVGRVEIREE